jgi:hypothetical protein
VHFFDIITDAGAPVFVTCLPNTDISDIPIRGPTHAAPTSSTDLLPGMTAPGQEFSLQSHSYGMAQPHDPQRP